MDVGWVLKGKCFKPILCQGHSMYIPPQQARAEFYVYLCLLVGSGLRQQCFSFANNHNSPPFNLLYRLISPAQMLT